MKITTKLLGSYLILAFIVLALGVLSLFGLHRLNTNSRELVIDRLQPAIVLSDIAQLMENSRVEILTGVINSDPTRGERALDNIDQINNQLALYQEHNLTEEEQASYNELARNWENFAAILIETEASLAEGDYTAARNGIRDGGAWYGAANMYVNELLALTEELSMQAADDNEEVYEQLRRLIIIAMVVAIVFAIAVAVLMGKLIGKPIKKISHRLTDVSKGDLTGQSIHSKRKDEIGVLEKATTMMQEELKHIILSVSQATNHVLSSSKELRQSTNEVVQGSEQIAVTMVELASGSESQATHTNELSEKMSKFVENIEESVSRSEDVRMESTTVRHLTEEGQKMMDASVTQMDTIDTIVKQSVDGVRGLDEQSTKVSSLVTVIEGIAEQTNLLALNAAIEAARAGEQGKGFAVVAEEVRKLSVQVSGSVDEITAIVGNMQKETSEVVDALEDGYGEVIKGKEQIQKTGLTFSEIAKSIEQMEQTIYTIAEALAENKQQTIDMSGRVEDIASISEESAAGIEETSASAQQSTSTMLEISTSTEELARLAEDLNLLVDRFAI